MWRVLAYLALVLAVALPATAEQDKPQPDNTPKASAEKTPSEEKAPALNQNDSGPAKGKEQADTARDFLRLAEPKSPIEKKTKKNIPWGGYWSPVYRGSPEEEEEESSLGGPSTAGRQKLAKPEEKPPSLAEYREVDFARLASGSYASEYADKYIKFRCRFASLAPEGMRLHDFSPPEYVNFIVVGPGSSMENLTVVARSGLADKVFRVESGKEITLYGRAHRLGLSGLTLIVDEIETGKK